VNRVPKRELLLGALLVATAVAVRWLGASAEWTLLPPNATPVAAIGLFAGFLFANRTAALLVPLAALAISNLALGSFLAAPLLGRWLRERPTAYRAVAAILLPALLFYVTTNFATWLVGFGGPHAAYAASWHGLALCYARGIPFFRWMLEGDIAFSAILFGGYALVAALAGNRSPRLKHRRLAPCR
jgi:hypothetical protein